MPKSEKSLQNQQLFPKQEITVDFLFCAYYNKKEQ